MVVCAIALAPRTAKLSRRATRARRRGQPECNTLAIQIDVLNQFSRESRGVFGKQVSMHPMELMGLDTALSDTRPLLISVVHVLHTVRRVCTIDASEIGHCIIGERPSSAAGDVAQR